MSDELQLLVKEYAQHPLQNFCMQDATISRHEGNYICWDDITVYLKLDEWRITAYSFDGNCSTITTAAASFLSEHILGHTAEELFTWNYETFVSWGFEVSPRRKRAAVIALLAARNAFHEVLGDGKEDVFADLIPD